MQPVLDRKCSIGVVGSLPILPEDLQAQPLLDLPMVTVVSPSHPLSRARGVISASAIKKQVQLVLTDRSMLSQGRDLPGSRRVVAGLRGGAARDVSQGRASGHDQRMHHAGGRTHARSGVLRGSRRLSRDPCDRVRWNGEARGNSLRSGSQCRLRERIELRDRSACNAEDLTASPPEGDPGFECGDPLRAEAFEQRERQIGWQCVFHVGQFSRFSVFAKRDLTSRRESSSFSDALRGKWIEPPRMPISDTKAGIRVAFA